MARGKQDRRQRVPFGVPRLKMTLDKETNDRLKRDKLVPRWINDEDHGQRLKAAQEGGYEFIEANGSEALGDGKEVQERDRAIKKLVGTNKDGSPKYAYLMAIKKEWYDEDQARKEDRNKLVDEAIQGGTPIGTKAHGIKPEHGGTYVKDIKYQP